MNFFNLTSNTRFSNLLVFFMLLISAAVCRAAENVAPFQSAPEGIWRLQFSPYTHHYRYDPDYKPAWVIGVENESKNGSLYGFAAISNSYGQPTAAAYIGHSFNNVWQKHPELYFKVIGGLAYGYVEPYADRVKFNYNGWVPIIMPAVGWNLNKDWGVQLNFWGDVAWTLSINKKF